MSEKNDLTKKRVSKRSGKVFKDLAAPKKGKEVKGGSVIDDYTSTDFDER
jgi:hypothetical protein